MARIITFPLLKRPKRSLTFAILAVVIFLSFKSTFETDNLIHEDESRSLSVALEDGGCFVLPAQEVGPDVKPVFAASYPGSGARMTWNLIEAMTGLVTGDDWNSNGRGKEVVSVKTHWPHPDQGQKLGWDDEIERAFLLFRNPMNAIPSFHNFVYEYENKIDHHTVRAPTEEWVKWRDRNFVIQLNMWKKHLEYWMDKYSPENRITIPYEHLIDTVQGPLVAKELGVFLGKGPGVNVIAEDSIPCVWGTVVKYQGKNSPNTRKPLPKDVKFVGSYPIWPGSHRKGPKARPYTDEQYTNMISVLEEMKSKYGAEGGRLIASLTMYIQDIEVAKSELGKVEAENQLASKQVAQE